MPGTGIKLTINSTPLIKKICAHSLGLGSNCVCFYFQNRPPSPSHNFTHTHTFPNIHPKWHPSLFAEQCTEHSDMCYVHGASGQGTKTRPLLPARPSWKAAWKILTSSGCAACEKVPKTWRLQGLELFGLSGFNVLILSAQKAFQGH